MTALEPVNVKINEVDFMAYFSDVETGTDVNEPFTLHLDGLEAAATSMTDLTLKADFAPYIQKANINTSGDGVKWVMTSMAPVIAEMTPDKVTLRVYQSDVENGGNSHTTDIPIEGTKLPGENPAFPNGLAGLMTVSDKQKLDGIDTSKYLEWASAFGWTDDILFRKNNTDGLFMEKKQKVLHNGTPGV
jgi:hypothetical protein